MALFETDPSGKKYDFSRFAQEKNLIKEFLMENPRSKVSCSWLKSSAEYSDVAGICCYAFRPEDVELLDDLLGFLDIPAGMDGLLCEIVRKPNYALSTLRAYLMVFDPDRIHPDSIKAIRFETFGTI